MEAIIASETLVTVYDNIVRYVSVKHDRQMKSSFYRECSKMYKAGVLNSRPADVLCAARVRNAM
jgi:hypothetical protein